MKNISSNDATGGTPELTLQAPAKINIGLRILGKRTDGYHEIWSVLQEINLCDEIDLWNAPDLSFLMQTDQPDIPGDESNLCLRAASLLKEETGYPAGARIRLRKVIPAGAGLGGGSSDAAAVLKGLNRLWKIGYNEADLMALAARLGSDVPFFILGGCCVATGRGATLKRIPSLVTDSVVLVCPGVHISTEWAYKNIKNYHLTSKMKSIIFRSSLPKIFRSSRAREIFVNDFESVVFAFYPELKLIKDVLFDSGAYFVSLSGSGSALFGLIRSADKAKETTEKLRSRWKTYCLQAR